MTALMQDAPGSSSPALGGVIVEKVTAGIRKIVFSAPPANIIGPETVTRLHEVVRELSDDASVQVVIFASGTPKFFFNHFDLRQASHFPVLGDARSTPVWVDLVVRLSTAPFVSIGMIRGRTRGGGNELALAMDLRYASREEALFGQPEVGTGILPGGGGAERLPRLVGRDRALEVILSSQDFDAETAERFGWVTRVVPDDELDATVEAIALRFASFDRTILAAAKRQIDRASLPPEDDLRSAFQEYTQSLSGAAFARTMGRLAQVAAKTPVELELHLGDYLGPAQPR